MACSQNGGSRSAFKILTGKPTGKRLLGRSRHRLKHNIRLNLTEIAINTMNWIDSAQGRDYWRSLVNATLKFRVRQAMELVINTALEIFET